MNKNSSKSPCKNCHDKTCLKTLKPCETVEKLLKTPKRHWQETGFVTLNINSNELYNPDDVELYRRHRKAIRRAYGIE